MMKKAAIMARVSSDDQAKGYSLGVQTENITKYCERNSIMIIKTIREDHSAKTFDRPAFKKFLEFAKTNKGQINLLLFTTWDRFSRNTGEAYEMIGRLRKLGIEPQATEQPLDLTIPENKAMLAFYLALPEIENDRRSIKITGGIRGARKAGRWTNIAPYGYKNARDENNKPIIVQTENAKHVLFAFEQLSLGIPMIDIRMMLHKKGYKVSKSQLSDILRNPLYMSMIPVKADEHESAYLQRGIHTPIITEELFYTVQSILTGKMRKLNKPSFTRRRPELLLRGLLRCDNCGKHVTGSPSKSHTGAIHFYYHCNHCKVERHKAQLINDVVEKLLDSFKYSLDVKTVYKKMLEIVYGGTNTEIEKRKKEVTKELHLIEDRINNLQDLLADKKITGEDYSVMKAKYERTKRDLIEETSSKKINSANIDSKLELIANRINNLGDIYRTSELDKKVRLLGSIFPLKFTFTGEKCRTQKLNSIIWLSYSIDKGFKQKKSAQLFQYLELDGVVENIGVEPTTSCMPCKRSSQLS
jgi:site-specific DNA recombinase